MKTFNKIFMTLGVAAAAFGMSSCVGDLDLEPNNPSEITDVANDMDRVFADIYLNFSTFGANGNSPVSGFDGGMASFQRAMFIAEELPTDEAAWLWDPASYGTLNYGKVVPTLDCVFGFYSRLNINIALCNQFIAAVNNGDFADGGSAKAQEYVRQAKILRSGCYYYMLSFYDKIPYSDESTPMGALPTQLPRAEVYRNVTATLEDVVAQYEAIDRNQKPYYGFVGLDAAEAILAKIYLNGEVFAGQADYANCYRHCKAIIDRLGHGGRYDNGLAYSYQGLFGANNKQYVLGNDASPVNEIIWTLAQDDPNLLSWSGATFMAVAWLGTNGVQATAKAPERADYDTQAAYDKAKSDYDALKDWEKTVSETVNGDDYSFDPKANGYIDSKWFNCGGGWKCLVARKSFVRKFEWDDAEMSVSKDRRVAQWLTSKFGFTVENPSLVGDDWGKNGYICPKYNNWNYREDGTIDLTKDAKDNYVNQPRATEQIGGDFAVIRLAEIYLTAAEAILQGGGGTQAEALRYVNYIRQRAYADTEHNLSAINMPTLRDERCRELYGENNRRTDLIRWNQWCTGYTWEWKGGVATGTNLPEYTKLYPIPSRVMTSSNFEQTTGY